MEKVSHFIDMAIDNEGDGLPEIQNKAQPIYPSGLSICLQDHELEKLGMESDCDVGDMLHGHFLAIVKSVSRNDTTEGTKTRVELQITHLSAESEDSENEAADVEFLKKPIQSYKKMYNEG